MNRRLCLLCLVFAACVANPTASANEIYKIDPARSTIGFKARHFFGSAAGKFSKFTGTIDLDREPPEKSSVSVTIQVASIDTGIAKRDEHLRSPDFFNIAKFPEITFKSRSVKQTERNKGEVIGELRMRGVTRTITLHVQQERANRWSATANPIKRHEFGLSWSKTVEAISGVGDAITIDLRIEAVRAAVNSVASAVRRDMLPHVRDARKRVPPLKRHQIG